MSNIHPLDRPIWNSLTTHHAANSVSTPRALAMRPSYGSLAAVADSSAESGEELVALIPEQGSLSLFDSIPMPPLPPGVRIVRQAPMHQMIADGAARLEPNVAALQLGESDAEEMLEFATLTQPGPFLRNTNRLGHFWGLREKGKLVAMAGQRLKLDGFTEVSGVCVHPDYRGRGYAADLVGLVTAEIEANGEVPFLHVLASNASAIAVYEKIGYAIRRTLMLTSIEREFLRP